MELPELGKNSSESINMLLIPHIDPSNPFAFSLEQMCQVVDQKHLDFLEKVGGIEGIAKGLHSNTKQGIVWNEENLSYIRMFDLVQPKEEFYDSQFPVSMDCDTFIQRRQIFGSNVLPKIEEVSLLELMWQSFQDKTLVN
jgi:Ca2+-transporting ATPase